MSQLKKPDEFESHENKQKRKRRLKEEMARNYNCAYENCGKSYG